MIYDIIGNEINTAYGVDGINVTSAYDVIGNIVFSSSYQNEITVTKHRNDTTGTTYYITTIPQTHSDGTKQYPFVFAPNGVGAATQSTYEMNLQYGFLVAVNAGVFFMPSNNQYTPQGTIIEDSIVIQQGSNENTSAFFQGLYAITINEDGSFGYADYDADAEEMVAGGVVSALHAFVPLIINFQDARDILQNSYYTNNADAQRQIIGQKSNGDYVIISCSARGFESSVGFTIPQVIQMCLDMELKDAFLLDGGGSMETVVGNTQINPFYEGTYGRKVPTYIVFNGTTEFGIPNN